MSAQFKNKCPTWPTVRYAAKNDFLSWTERDKIRSVVFMRDPNICVWCQGKVAADNKQGNYFTVDHIITRTMGGAYAEDNLVLACKPCNNSRGSLSIIEFLIKRAQ